MKTSHFLFALFVATVGIASAGPIQMDYSLDLRSGTLNGSSVTNVAIFETGGGQSSVAYGLVAPSSGAFILSHMASFVPSSSLIIGLDVPLTPGKTHVVVFANQAFVDSANGQRFRTMFPSASYSEFVDQFTQANGGSPAAQSWMMNFFQGDGMVAAFPTGSPAAAIEFSIGVVPPPVGVPEPTTYGLVGFGLAAMVAARRRLKHVRRSSTCANVDSGDCDSAR
jgi:PEP-CTERM motif